MSQNPLTNVQYSSQNYRNPQEGVVNQPQMSYVNSHQQNQAYMCPQVPQDGPSSQLPPSSTVHDVNYQQSQVLNSNIPNHLTEQQYQPVSSYSQYQGTNSVSYPPNTSHYQQGYGFQNYDYSQATLNQYQQLESNMIPPYQNQPYGQQINQHQEYNFNYAATQQNQHPESYNLPQNLPVSQNSLPPVQNPASVNNAMNQNVSTQHKAPVPPISNESKQSYEQHPRQPLPPKVQKQPPSMSKSSKLGPTPGMISSLGKDPRQCITIDEWTNLKSPISLMQDKNILPSDGLDMPKMPAVNTPVNCDPSLMRCTLTSIPSSQKLLSKCRLPLGLLLHPFRDLNTVCIVQSKIIVRCRSCRTYINPFVQFRDGGRRWQCPVCLLTNAVPDDFFYDPMTEHYGDPTRRPEIRSSTVEYIASSEYMLRPPQAATYVFCFQVNRAAISSGALLLACERLSAKLTQLPGDVRKQIAIITYDSSIHFYKLNDTRDGYVGYRPGAKLRQSFIKGTTTPLFYVPEGETPRMLLCPDVEDVFIPDMDGLLVNLDSSMEVIDDLLQSLPKSFANTQDTGNCLGSVLQVALKLIGSSGGRITVINCDLPTIGAGALSMREEQKDRSVPDIKRLQPSTDFYKMYALDCASKQIAVDLFVLSSQYCDIATIGGAARHCGGSILHYPEFSYIPLDKSNAEQNGEEKVSHHSNIQKNNPGWIEVERFRQDFDRYLTRKIGFEAVVRVRCSRGLVLQVSSRDPNFDELLTEDI